MVNLNYVEIINKCQNLNGLILVLNRLMDEESVPTELRGSFLKDLISQEDIRNIILKLFTKALIANPLVFNMPEIVKFMEIDKVDGNLAIHAFSIYYDDALSYNFEELITAIFLTIEDLNLQSIIKPDKESWFEIKKAREREESGYEQDFLNIWHPKENPNTDKEDSMHIQISSDSDFKNIVFDGVVPKEENIIKTNSVLPLTSDENINNSINSMVGTIDSVDGLLLWIYTQDKYRETILYHNDSVINRFRELSLIEYFSVDTTIEKPTMVHTNIYRYILILMYNQKYGVTLTATLDRDTRNTIDYLISRYKRDIPLQSSEFTYICKKILSFDLKDNI